MGNNDSQELSFLPGVFTAFLCISFGANAVAVKMSLLGIGIFTTAALRFTIASAAIILWARFTHQTFYIKKGQIRHLVVLFVIFTVQLSLFYLGISLTNASRATLIVNFQPFFLLLLAHFFLKGDYITKQKIIGMVLGFSGVVLIIFQQQGVSENLHIGDIIIFIVTFIWAVNAAYTKKIIGQFLSFHLVLYPMIFSIPILFFEGLLWDKKMIFHLDAFVIGSLLYQALVTASFGFIAWNNMLRKYHASSLHAFMFLMPVSGVVLGNLLLGEPLTGRILISLLLIVSGIIIVQIKIDKNFIFNLKKNKNIIKTRV